MGVLKGMKSKTRFFHHWCWFLGALLILGAVSSSMSTVHAQAASNTVFVVQIQKEIDLGLAPFLARVFSQAEQENAQAVILEIDTPGGRLDAVLQMQDTILDSPIRTIAFVNRQAFSAGALIAIAANEIYMAPGAVMGAATPVDAAGTPGEEKVISAVRSTFRATAEARGRDPRIAEAMVDPAVEIEGLISEGQLLTLTTSEAQEVGYLDGVSANRQELLQMTGLEGATLQEPSPSLAENVVRFLTNPLVASLLISLGFLLILVDAWSGGFGIVGGVGLVLLAVFFWGHFLAGLAGWEGVALVLLGLVLIGVEVFIIPGFGIAGILGLAALLGGLFISVIRQEIITQADLERAGRIVGLAFLLMVVGVVLMLWYLPRAARVQGLILEAQVGIFDDVPQRRHRWKWLEGARLEAHRPSSAEGRPAPREPVSLLGAKGVALSDLRPGGFAEIGGERVDVVTRGDYIRAGEPIEVISDEGYRRVVRRVRPDEEESSYVSRSSSE
jgi:membrane-bound serine protease (ClpP class)